MTPRLPQSIILVLAVVTPLGGPRAQAPVASQAPAAPMAPVSADQNAIEAWTRQVSLRLLNAVRKAPLGFYGNAVVLLGFTLDRQGRVVGSAIKQGSGHEIVDKAVLSVLAKAAPFDPFPPSMDTDQIEMAVPIRFREPKPAKKAGTP